MSYGYDSDGYEAECVCCVRDYGYDMNDVRGRWYVGAEAGCECLNCQEGYPEDCELAEDRSFSIVIKRAYSPCPVCDGEYGSTFTVSYEVTDSGNPGLRVPFPEMYMAEAYILAICPEAEENVGWIAEDTGMRHY